MFLCSLPESLVPGYGNSCFQFCIYFTYDTVYCKFEYYLCAYSEHIFRRVCCGAAYILIFQNITVYWYVILNAFGRVIAM